MNKEELLALGLSEEQVSEVIDGFGHMIPKSRFDEVNNEKNELKKQLSERDEQLKELAKSNKDNEELTKKIKELQTLNETKSKEYEETLSKLKLDNLIELSLTNNGSKNNKALKALLDMEKIKIENDKLVGFDEQIKSLKESDKYLFNSFKEEKMAGVTPKVGNTDEKKSVKPTTYDDFLKMEMEKGE